MLENDYLDYTEKKKGGRKIWIEIIFLKTKTKMK